MRYVCDAPGGRTWFRIETEAEAVAESETMRHAVEKYFRKEQDKAAQSFRPISKVYFEQEIGLKAHIQREMPLFLTLRDDDGTPLATAMLPPNGRDDRSFRPIIVGPGNADPYPEQGDAIRALGPALWDDARTRPLLPLPARLRPAAPPQAPAISAARAARPGRRPIHNSARIGRHGRVGNQRCGPSRAGDQRGL